MASNPIVNMFKVKELRSRMLFTLLILAIFRLGSVLTIPGIDANVLLQYFDNLAAQNRNAFASYMDFFVGGAFSNFSIFMLGVMPYISMQIIMQLAVIIFPSLKKAIQEDGGQRKFATWTRIGTIFVCLLQSYAITVYASSIPGCIMLDPRWKFNALAMLTVTTGSMITVWLGDQITARGIGNGISMMIFAGIVARLPYAITAELLEKFQTTNGGPILLIVEAIIWFFVIISAIAIVQAVRRVPVQYAKRVIGNKQYGGARQYIPLKINAAGVMPIIFAQTLMLFPLFFSRFEATRGIAAALSNYTGLWYNLIFGLLVVLFTYFYTAVTVNPTMMATEMKQNGGFIPGVKPGNSTAEYLDEIMSRITLPGSIFLALISIMPAITMKAGVTNQFASFFGGTSLLILVGVVIDTLQQIESYLLMRHYDGLMKTGRLTGRSGM